MQPAGETDAVNAWPAMVAIRVCWAVVGFGDAVTVTLPLPDPAAGATDSATLAVEADHAEGAHPDGAAVTFTTCDPPPVAKFAVDGEIANVQAVFVGVGWVVAAASFAEGPPHPGSARSTREAAKEHVSFIGGYDTSQAAIRCGF